MVTRDGPVLVSWVAVNTDPYEQAKDGIDPAPGPTLTLLFDESSEFCRLVKDVVLLRREPAYEQERLAAEHLELAIRERDSDINVHPKPWRAEDPTDHEGIFRFLKSIMPRLRTEFSGRELIVHVSPGTPSMHTIWVLMGETGFIEPPFRLVKSYRRHERKCGPAVVPVELGIETFYKAYVTSRPREVTSEEQTFSWKPEKFSGDTMRNLFREARRFAQVKVPVLLLGERGTGKTTIAGWIRSNSPFRVEERDNDWPAVACGQYSPELLGSELFGHVKGAYTGAVRDRDGLLSRAHRDTLFLDEIGDLTGDNQRRIIKAVEERKYYPLGDDKSQTSDFRMLTATNRSMDELRQHLHPDFLDRISHLTLRLPALRDIPEELHWLWDTIFCTATVRAGVDNSQAQLPEACHRHVVDALERDPLPGNMRDLFRVAYRVLAARGDTHEPLSPSDAVDYGLEALREFGAPADQIDSQSVARAFADSEPLDAVLRLGGRLSTKDVVRDLQKYMANEIRRISRVAGRPIDQLCDREARTLLNWSKVSD